MICRPHLHQTKKKEKSQAGGPNLASPQA